MAVDSRIVRPDEGGAAVQRNRLAETGARRTVARGELLHLTPRAIRLGEHIERSLACVAADSGLRRTDEYGRALERDCEAKVIVGRTIIGSEFLRLRPSTVRLSENIDGALGSVATDSGTICTDNERAAIERHRGTKVVEQSAIACGELLTFTPSAVRLGEQVGRALASVAAHSGSECTDEKGIVGECDPIAEFVPRQAVARGQLLSLAPTAVRFGEQVGCTLETVVAVGAYECSGAVERRSRAKVAVCRAVARSDLLLHPYQRVPLCEFRIAIYLSGRVEKHAKAMQKGEEDKRTN